MTKILYAAAIAALMSAAPAFAQGTDQNSSNQDTAIKTREGDASTLPGASGAQERNELRKEDRAGEPATRAR